MFICIAQIIHFASDQIEIKNHVCSAYPSAALEIAENRIQNLEEIVETTYD